MVLEDDKYIIHGIKTSVPIPEGLVGKFIYDTLSIKDVHHDAMVDAFTGERISYDQILEDTCNLAEALRQYGCDSNTVISVCSPNSLHFFTPVIATLYLGATVAPLNHLYKEYELLHMLSLFKPKIIFCSLSIAEKIILMKLELDFIEKIILIEGGAKDFGIENISTFVEKQLDGKFVNPNKFEPFTDADPRENVSFILSSSGTTGLPKGVMLSDRSHLILYTFPFVYRHRFLLISIINTAGK